MPRPSIVTCSSMPRRPMHHKSSSAPSHAQSAAGPWTWTTSSLVGTSWGSSTQSPSWNRARTPVRSSTNAALPTRVRTGSVAPIVNSSTPVDVVRSSRRLSVDQTAPSGATVAWSAGSTSNGIDSPLRASRAASDVAGATTTKPLLPTPETASDSASGATASPGSEPECRRIDQSGFGVRAVEEVGPAGPFGDRDRRTVRRGVEPDQCLTAVTVGENDATGRLVHEPTRGSRRRRVDRGQPI